LDSFSNAIKADLLRACLLVFFLSLGKMVSRDFQLEAIAHSLTGHDELVTAATGSGKTLIMTALSLLRPEELTVLIGPLKHLKLTLLHDSCLLGRYQ
jgi:Lhr-like helicase